MSLIFEIEYLTGVAFAGTGPDSDAPDWPPQPDRVFSALVASWAARGMKVEETQALEWLEAQEVPNIAASDMEPRLVATSFVPPNDPKTSQVGDVGVMPAHRRRQPRLFPAARPHDRVVRLQWPEAIPQDTVLSALSALARDTAYVGHSASLTRCRFVCVDFPADVPSLQPARRRIYPGRFAELQTAFKAGRRPRPGDAVVVQRRDQRTPYGSAFATHWLLLDHVAGEMPDIRAAGLVVRVIRDSLLTGYRRIGLGDQIPEVVSGHGPDGRPSAKPHLAIVPLAFAGLPYSDGRVLGFALIPPRGGGLLEDADFLSALRAVAFRASEQGPHVLTVTSKPTTPDGNGFSIDLAVTSEAHRRSLDPAPYLGPARTFATVTPIVLDRHLKETGSDRDGEKTAQIIAACRNIGLPAPTAEDVLTHKHPALEGPPSAWSSGTAPTWTRWRLPPFLASRPLVHAVIRFPEPVEGPVLLGAGRYIGLGLCLAIEERGRSWQFQF